VNEAAQVFPSSAGACYIVTIVWRSDRTAQFLEQISCIFGGCFTAWLFMRLNTQGVEWGAFESQIRVSNLDGRKLMPTSSD
jgi:hypothetical protein